jgi:hypothetical protein
VGIWIERVLLPPLAILCGLATQVHAQSAADDAIPAAAFESHSGTIRSGELVAIAGTRSRQSIWLSKRAAGIQVEGDGVSVDDVRVADEYCNQQGCFYRTDFSLLAGPDATLSRRDIVVQLEDGEKLTLPGMFQVTHRRLIVFAVDGLGWTPFWNVRDAAPALQRLFGTDPIRLEGQNVTRQVLTTFTPITFGRWATVFSEADPKDTGVPSNEYVNRRAVREGTCEHGDVSQCLGCGTFGHLTYTLSGSLGDSGAYNRHFHVPFVYDRLRGNGARRRSAVFGQQAGLGMLNSLPDPAPDNWVTLTPGLIWRLLFSGGDFGRGYDAWIRDAALDELAKSPLIGPKADFDIMVLYFGGLDDDLHQGRVRDPQSGGVSDHPSEQYAREYLDGLVEEIVASASARLRRSAIYVLAVDHGHIPVSESRWIDLTQRGAAVSFASGGPQSMRDVLTADGTYRVSKTLLMDGTGQPANVVFVPSGGMAHVYVASQAAGGALAWLNPASLERLAPLVSRIHQATHTATNGPVAGILVRTPAEDGQFASSEYRVVPADYVPPTCGADGRQPCASTCGPDRDAPCTLEAQLLGLSSLDTEASGAGASGFHPVDAERRIAEWVSENTGDIVLLANMKEGFYFDRAGLVSTHGSLTSLDSLTPLALAYPGATSELESEDDVLQSARAFLETQTGPLAAPAHAPIVRRALESALGLTPCERQDEGKCEQPR